MTEPPTLVPPPEHAAEHWLEKLNREKCEKLGVGRCPFCGGAPRISGGDQSHWHITCASCNAMSGLGLTGKDAAEAWNRRDPNAAARIAELEGEVKRLRALVPDPENKETETRVMRAIWNAAHPIARFDEPDVGPGGNERATLTRQSRAAIRALTGESHD